MTDKTEPSKKCSACQKEIPARAKKCPYCQTDLRSWFRRHPIITGILILFGLGIIMAAAGGSSQKGTTKPTTSPPVEQRQETKGVEEKQEVQKPKEWTKVIEISGNSNKRTDTFTLYGGKTKLTYNVKGTTAVVVSIYVLPEGHSLQEQGGFPEVTVTEPGTDTTFLNKKAGNYYLDIISANASWTVKIEEER